MIDRLHGVGTERQRALSTSTRGLTLGLSASGRQVAQRHLRVGKAARDDVCGVCGGAGAAQAASVLPRLARPAPGRRLRIQPQVAEDLLDDRSLEDGRDDLELATATVGAVLHVDVEHALEQPRPTDEVRYGLLPVQLTPT